MLNTNAFYTHTTICSLHKRRLIKNISDHSRGPPRCLQSLMFTKFYELGHNLIKNHQRRIVYNTLVITLSFSNPTATDLVWIS